MRFHPCFRRRWFLQVCLASLPMEAGLCGHQSISVGAQATAKIRPRPVQGLFSNGRTWQNHWSYCPDEWKVEKAECHHAPIRAVTCQNGPTGKFVSCVEKDSLCWTVMMAWIWHVCINALVFVPLAQTPPKAGANELLYSLNLIDEFTSLFSPKLIYAGSLRKKISQKRAYVDISVFLWLRQQRPRFAQGQPKGYLQLKELHRPTTNILKWMNAAWKVEKAQYAEFNVPTCGKIAVWQLCRETQPLWNSHDSSRPELNMLGSMPWCSFPWHKLLPRPAQKNCYTV